MKEINYNLPMEVTYREEKIIFQDRQAPQQPICFSQWVGEKQVIFGNQNELFFKCLESSTVLKNPLEGLKSYDLVHCMMVNSSQTKLVVACGKKFIVYSLPELRIIHLEENLNDLISEVCWMDESTFASINSTGLIQVRAYVGGVFQLYNFKGTIPDFETSLHNNIKYHVFDYHSKYEKFFYLSQNQATLNVIGADLSEFDFIPLITNTFLGGIREPLLMIALHSSNPNVFLASHKLISVYRADNHELIHSIQISDLIYSMSVAGNVLTYSVGTEPKGVRIRIWNEEKSIHSLISREVVTVSSRVAEKETCALHPLIITHCYNLNRRQIFCGGAIKEIPFPMWSYPHATIWSASDGSPIESKEMNDHDITDCHTCAHRP